MVLQSLSSSESSGYSFDFDPTAPKQAVADHDCATKGPPIRLLPQNTSMRQSEGLEPSMEEEDAMDEFDDEMVDEGVVCRNVSAFDQIIKSKSQIE